MVLWVAPYLAECGPSPIGAKKANLDTLTNDRVLQFAYQEVGHLKAIKKNYSPRPQLDFNAVIRGLLFELAAENVSPYQFVIAEFTNRISNLRNTLGHTDGKDEGLIVPIDFCAEGKVAGNVLAGDQFSLAIDRTEHLKKFRGLFMEVATKPSLVGSSLREVMTILPDLICIVPMAITSLYLSPPCFNSLQ
ncbi:hypothetical protein V6N11_003325 [Hibiscus sabdariffa]|uniref:Uncharacterized protein n=1 Tax=Hibiscus sabdariffa TaxID=183260 RepID=A0ABR2SDK3_9ROSI